MAVAMGIGNIGWSELVVIAIIVLVFFGPRRLPEIANAVGRSLREFRKALNEVRTEISQASGVNDPSIRPPVAPLPGSVSPADPPRSKPGPRPAPGSGPAEPPGDESSSAPTADEPDSEPPANPPDSGSEPPGDTPSAADPPDAEQDREDRDGHRRDTDTQTD